LGFVDYSISSGWGCDLFTDQQRSDKTIVLSQEDSDQHNDQPDNENHRKNMSFHNAALASKVLTSFTPDNTSLVVFLGSTAS